MTEELNDFSYWERCLESPREIGKSIPVHPSEAHPGFWRVKNRNGAYDPVSTFYVEGMDQMIALRANREVDPLEIWTYCVTKPVSYEAYESALKTGKWPDDDETVAAQLSPPAPGHNSEGVTEEEELRDQIDSAVKGIDAYKNIATEEAASKALSLRNRLNELSGKANNKREVLVRPHLDKQQEINGTWMPLVKKAKEGADKVKKAIEAYSDRQRAAEREKARQAEIEAAKAAASAAPETPAPAQPEPVETAPVQVRATYGRAASVKVKTVVDTVPDWKALAVYFCNEKTVQDELLKQAQKYIDAGKTDVPVTTREASKI